VILFHFGSYLLEVLALPFPRKVGVTDLVEAKSVADGMLDIHRLSARGNKY
jgi:hypothetical protein